MWISLLVTFINPVKFGWNPTSSLIVKAVQSFIYFSSDGHFVQHSGTCRWHDIIQLGLRYRTLLWSLVEIPPVISPAKDGRYFLSIFSSGGNFLSEAARSAICTSMLSTFRPKSIQQFDLWKSKNDFLFLAHCSLKAGQELSIFSSGGHFLQWSGGM